MPDDKFSRHPEFAGEPVRQDTIVVDSILEVPTHRGVLMPHIVANETAINVFEHAPGKHCVALSHSHHEQNHGYVSLMLPDEVDKMVALLLDAKANVARLHAGESFIPSAPLTRQ